MKMKSYKDIDEYLDNFSGETRKKLDEIRSIVHELAPQAKEKIAYGIPTFTYHGNLLHFAGYETHIGFYPGPAPIKQFANELSGYETSKGTIKFPLDKPLPLDLIRKITKACVERNEAKKK
ncbi:MAG TPA: DUF1801 domain-containing protein [Candidatus Saccharimonadales bacterium]|nr:DUF1801 domain-containing protein [Candidatus Saccharimonadales bacterium]